MVRFSAYLLYLSCWLFIYRFRVYVYIYIYIYSYKVWGKEGRNSQSQLISTSHTLTPSPSIPLQHAIPISSGPGGVFFFLKIRKVPCGMDGRVDC